MALNPKTSVAQRNLGLDAMTPQLDGGFCDIYSGTQPAGPDSPVSGGAVLLARLALSSPAFAPASGGQAVANAISSASALADGVAAWFRLTASGGVAKHDGW